MGAPLVPGKVALGFILLLLAGPGSFVDSQSLDYVYWTPVVGQPQQDTSQALAIVNGSDATVFSPSSAPGVANTMVYQKCAFPIPGSFFFLRCSELLRHPFCLLRHS